MTTRLTDPRSCCRCGDVVHLAQDAYDGPVLHGWLYPKGRFGSSFTVGLPDRTDYLCGDCFYDLTDFDED